MVDPEKAEYQLKKNKKALDPIYIDDIASHSHLVMEALMCRFVDQPVPSLDNASRLFIWAMRDWVQANSNQRCPCASLGPMFHKWQMTEGLPEFMMAMAHLNSGTKEELIFGQKNCGNVHENEAILLTIHRNIWRNEFETAKMTCETLMTAQAASHFITAMRRYFNQLSVSPLGDTLLPAVCNLKITER